MKCEFCNQTESKTYMFCEKEKHFFCKECAMFLRKRCYECPYCNDSSILILKCFHTNCDWKENLMLYPNHVSQCHNQNEVPIIIEHPNDSPNTSPMTSPTNE